MPTIFISRVNLLNATDKKQYSHTFLNYAFMLVEIKNKIGMIEK